MTLLITELSVSIELNLTKKLSVSFTFGGGKLMEVILMTICLVGYTGLSGVCVQIDCSVKIGMMFLMGLCPEVQLL